MIAVKWYGTWRDVTPALMRVEADQDAVKITLNEAALGALVRDWPGAFGAHSFEQRPVRVGEREYTVNMLGWSVGVVTLRAA